MGMKVKICNAVCMMIRRKWYSVDGFIFHRAWRIQSYSSETLAIWVISDMFQVWRSLLQAARRKANAN